MSCHKDNDLTVSVGDKWTVLKGTSKKQFFYLSESEKKQKKQTDNSTLEASSNWSYRWTVTETCTQINTTENAPLIIAFTNDEMFYSPVNQKWPGLSKTVKYRKHRDPFGCIFIIIIIIFLKGVIQHSYALAHCLSSHIQFSAVLLS